MSHGYGYSPKSVEGGEQMVGWMVLVAAVAALVALLWWSAGVPERGPGDKLARRFRESGGWLGGWFGGGR